MLDEDPELRSDAVFVFRHDCRVRQRYTAGMPEQRDDREPVGEAADQRGFAERLEPREHRVLRAQAGRNDKDDRHDGKQCRSDRLHAPQAGAFDAYA
ncbi:MAG TPA: hypothetical protein VFE70_00985, partial [Candidatus Elarobacter sp.]|nr:hypothetical protein [Candidatus Elarobacter sp.]